MVFVGIPNSILVNFEVGYRLVGEEASGLIRRSSVWSNSVLAFAGSGLRNQFHASPHPPSPSRPANTGIAADGRLQ
jgi:hypothetical protein